MEVMEDPAWRGFHAQGWDEGPGGSGDPPATFSTVVVLVVRGCGVSIEDAWCWYVYMLLPGCFICITLVVCQGYIQHGDSIPTTLFM